MEQEQRRALRAFIEVVAANGGIYYKDGAPATVATGDAEMAGAYLLACAALGVEPSVVPTAVEGSPVSDADADTDAGEKIAERDHGLGEIPYQIIGAPTWQKAGNAQPCPNCGAELVVCGIQVKSPHLTTGSGRGKYAGCPCCPWAGPMLLVAGSNLH